MAQKVLIVSSKNVTPETEVNEKLAALGNDWKIVSIDTKLQPWGERETGSEFIQAWHVYYVTTVVVENNS